MKMAGCSKMAQRKGHGLQRQVKNKVAPKTSKDWRSGGDNGRNSNVTME
jgi:hypothetical protein